MSIGRSDRLTQVLEDLFDRGNGRFQSAVVTNERGLIVTKKVHGDHPEESLAAMTALLSDASVRVNSNLELGMPELAVVRSSSAQLAVKEFPVRKKPFRIGLVIKDKKKRWWHRGMTPEKIEKSLTEAAESVRAILESK
ncbi:MAG: hypothetical protein BAJATHORv1_30483 [Candidatus Thorarchaeota archaeon]|nr:MAG: hypothetical protein BAJATHORv1_30483 [Candidatus Thorarchaeota archaeon]